MVDDKKLSSFGLDDVENNFAFFYMKDGTFLFPKGKFYLYFLDTDEHAKQLQNQTGEIDFLFFPFKRRFDMTSNPIGDIWKRRGKNHKGAEHILGIIEGQVYEEEKLMVIQMMSVRPAYKFNKINSFMVGAIKEWVEKYWNGFTIAFENPTDEGLNFALKYDKNMMIFWNHQTYRPENWKELKDQFPNVKQLPEETEKTYKIVQSE